MVFSARWIHPSLRHGIDLSSGAPRCLSLEVICLSIWVEPQQQMNERDMILHWTFGSQKTSSEWPNKTDTVKILVGHLLIIFASFHTLFFSGFGCLTTPAIATILVPSLIWVCCLCRVRLLRYCRPWIWLHHNGCWLFVSHIEDCGDEMRAFIHSWTSPRSNGMLTSNYLLLMWIGQGLSDGLWRSVPSHLLLVASNLEQPILEAIVLSKNSNVKFSILRETLNRHLSVNLLTQSIPVETRAPANLPNNPQLETNLPKPQTHKKRCNTNKNQANYPSRSRRSCKSIRPR